MTTYGYCRVSTDRQTKSGLSIREQVAQVTRYAEYIQADLGTPKTRDLDGTPLEVPNNVVIDGESAYKKEFTQRAGGSFLHKTMTRGDAIIIPKLDRIFRSTKDGLAMLETWEIRGIRAHFLDLKVDTGTPSGKLIFTVMAAMAEWESSRRSERQKDAYRTLRITNPEGIIKGDYAYHGFRFTATSRADRKRRRLVPDETQRWKQDLFYEMWAHGHALPDIRKFATKKGIRRSDGLTYFEDNVAEAVSVEHGFRQLERDMIAAGDNPNYEEVATLWLANFLERQATRDSLRRGEGAGSPQKRPPVPRQVELRIPGDVPIPDLRKSTLDLLR